MELGIKDMVGRTFSRVMKVDDYELHFIGRDNTFIFYHDQQCCENVLIEDICGDLDDLHGAIILVAEERTSSDLPGVVCPNEYCTWTFYEFATIKGSVTVRWVGSSNGYYSESVDLKVVPTKYD